MTRRSGFSYDAERRERGFKRRYLESANFDSQLFRVLWLDDAAPLCRYLTSAEPLSAEDRAGLAWMLEQMLRRPKRGRPRGRSRSPLHDAAFRVCSAVRKRRDAERSKAGRERYFKGGLTKLVEQAIADDEMRHPSSKGMLTADYILIRLKKR